ncbi:MAG: hypothetical protein GY719_18480 [bacterium]|nr:hypothetical protein [bacterium]
MVIEFLKTWGALIIAFIALARPWVKSAWRHFYQRPTLFPHPTGTIEIGFGNFGPSIGVMGTLEAYQTLQRMRYWEAGRYRLELRVSTSHPNAIHSTAWNFELDDSQANNLRLNIIKVLQDLCIQPYGQYNFAYVQYQDETTQ